MLVVEGKLQVEHLISAVDKQNTCNNKSSWLRPGSRSTSQSKSGIASLRLAWPLYLILIWLTSLIKISHSSFVSQQLAAHNIMQQRPTSYRPRIVLDQSFSHTVNKTLPNKLDFISSYNKTTGNGSSSQSYLDRKNFGHRIQWGPVYLANGTFSAHKAMEQPSTFNTIDIRNNDKRDFETTRLDNSDQLARHNYFNSSSQFRLAHRHPVLSPSLLDSNTNFSDTHLNISHSINMTRINDNTTEYVHDQFFMVPQLVAPQTQLGNHLSWTDSAQESFPIGINFKLGNNQTVPTMTVLPGVGRDDETKDYQIAELKPAHDNNYSNDLQALSQESSMFVPRYNQSVGNQLDWEASELEQVIQLKTHSGGTSGHKDEEEQQQSLKSGSAENSVNGEQIQDHEDSSKWKEKNHVDQQETGNQKKGAKEGLQWLKDMGHNRHGWKNVYHKEEYGQHQKYHDVIRDKNFNSETGKLDESYQFNNGDRFNETNMKHFYDKDQHRNKYDYNKGNEWKRYENELYDEDGVANEITEKKQDQLQLESPLKINQNVENQPEPRDNPISHGRNMVQHGGHTEASSSLRVQSHNPRTDSISDEVDNTIIGQIQNKLERLSNQIEHKAYKMNNPKSSIREFAAATRTTKQTLDQDQKRGSVGNGVDYDADWRAQNDGELNTRLDSATPGDPQQSKMDDIVDIGRRADKQGRKTDASRFSHGNNVNQNNSSISPHNNQVGRTELNNDGDGDYIDDTDDDSVSGDDGGNKIENKNNQAGKVNQKNELRLNLELDLGKSVGQKFSNQRKNQTVNNNQLNEVISRPKEGTIWLNGSQNSGHSNISWQPKESRLQLLRQRDNSNQSKLSIKSQDRLQTKVTNTGSRYHNTTTEQSVGGLRFTPQIRKPPLYRDNRTKQSSSKTPVGWRAKQLDSNVNKSSLTNLIQVLPTSVKHLKVNGGVVLKKDNNQLSWDANNRSQGRRTRSKPIIIDDFIVESPYMNIFGGLQHQLSSHNENLHIPAAAFDQAERDYVMTFADYSAESAKREPMVPIIEGEPNVIFEASASTIDDERQPYNQNDDYNQINTMNSLLSESQHYNLNVYPYFEAFDESTPIRISYHNQVNNQHGFIQSPPITAPSLLSTPLQIDNRIPNLLKSASGVYATNTLMDPIGLGSGSSARMIPTMQQALSRFLRLPRVLSLAPNRNNRQHTNMQTDRSTVSVDHDGVKWKPIVIDGSFRSIDDLATPNYIKQQHNLKKLNYLMNADSNIVPTSFHPMLTRQVNFESSFQSPSVNRQLSQLTDFDSTNTTALRPNGSKPRQVTNLKNNVVSKKTRPMVQYSDNKESGAQRKMNTSENKASKFDLNYTLPYFNPSLHRSPQQASDGNKLPAIEMKILRQNSDTREENNYTHSDYSKPSVYSLGWFNLFI